MFATRRPERPPDAELRYRLPPRSRRGRQRDRRDQREIATRFDFKGSKCKVKRDEAAINLLADDDLKLKQMHELLKVHLTRRKVDPAALEFKPPEKASGNTMRQTVVLRQGSTPTSPARWCAASRTAN